MRILGVDFGARRIGLAISDVSGTLAVPLKAVKSFSSFDEAVEAVGAEIEFLMLEEDGLGAVVVGLPFGLDGKIHRQTDRAKTFGKALSQRVSIPVEFQDERLSSREAERVLALREKDWRKRKKKLDAVAAAVFLQEYLNRQEG